MPLHQYGMTRRRMLLSAAAALAGSRVGWASQSLPMTGRASRRSLRSAFPDQRDPVVLHAVARSAIEAAIEAGAAFADVRVTESRQVSVVEIGGLFEGRMDLGYSYGVRVYVDGVWGFGYGIDPAPERVAVSTQQLVRSLRFGRAGSRGTQTPLFSTPVVHGEWMTPIRIDPFGVSPDDYVAAIMAIGGAVAHTPGAGIDFPNLEWHGETRVVASSDGSLTTQQLTRALPLWNSNIWIRDIETLQDGESSWSLADLFPPESAGFEVVTGPDLQEQIKTFTEIRSKWASLPTMHHFPVGRYNAVLDGAMTASLLGQSLIPALSLDRALGIGHYSHGLNVFRPGSTPRLSPFLNLTIGRAVAHRGAARWDDEGVATQSFAAIANGNVIEYVSSRSTAAALVSEVPTPPGVGQPLLRGCGVTTFAHRAPVDAATSAYMAPGVSTQSLETLAQTLGHGVLFSGRGNAGMNAALTTGLCFPQKCYEIRLGRVVRRILGAAMQFSTTPFWQQLVTTGGPSTVESNLAITLTGRPMMPVMTQVFAPAVLMRDVSVVDYEVLL
jgi:TldD protein